MRKGNKGVTSTYKIMVVDDEIGVIDSLSVVFKRSGYQISGTTDPVDAVEQIRGEHFDMLILDYLMTPIHGDRVVELIREFNPTIYILLLTGYKDLVPPLKTIKTLDIQGYCEKSDKFDQLLLMVESGIKSIAQMQTITKFKDGLDNILKSIPNIYRLQPIGDILEVILIELMPIIKSDGAFILVDDLSAGGECVFRGAGLYASEVGDVMGNLDTELLEKIGYARTARQTVILKNGMVLPLKNGDKGSIGILYAEMEDIYESAPLVEIFVNQALAALNNAFFHIILHRKNAELDSTYESLRQNYTEIVEVLRVVVDAKDVYTRGHSDRVSFFSVKIGEKLGLKSNELEMLRISSLFHDIGKLGTSDSILLKTGKLTFEEYAEIKKHPVKGVHILSAVSVFQDIIPIVRYHHERVDGKGYPEGLRGDQIPFLARITAVADSFDAMTSDRTYRPRLSLQQSLEQLTEGMGAQFDEKVVQAFVELSADYDAMLTEFENKYASELFH